jgi:ferrous iron transport protein B
VEATAPVTLALAGQPNVGKSTVFNALTGLNQHVGNWPGKTVEQKTGRFERRGRRIELVDLPGTYSLTSGSEEERVARDYLIKQAPAAVIAVVNAASLERNLYLLAELLTLPVPVVVGLNMLDVAESHGLKVEAPVLAAALGVPVVELVASKGRGLGDLLDAGLELADHPESFRPNRPVIRAKHLPVLRQIGSLLDGRAPAGYPLDWVSLKLLEGDADVARLVQEQAPDVWDPINALLAEHEDAYLDIAGGRYDWVARMVRAAVVKPKPGATVLTDRIDRVATHPFWGLLILIVALGVIFGITYTVASPAAGAIAGFISGPFSDLLRSLLSWAPAWISGLIVDGVVAGAGAVAAFIPILVVFFAALGVLEDVGYMARSAYVMDRYMHRMGLHGKSCLPLMLGFGCNVPAILGTRIIEDRRARLLTMMLTPFVPCTARLAVLAFLAPAFFGANAAWAVAALVGGNLVVIAVIGVTVNRVAFKGERSAFVMEMPLYHVPNARTIGFYVWRNTTAFLRKAGKIIVLCSAVVWVLSNFPGNTPGESILGMIGKALEPFFSLMGLGDWRVIVALLSSFVAKENAVATLGVLFGQSGGSAAGVGVGTLVAAILTPAAAAAFLVVVMTFIPCVATVTAIKQESRSWRFLWANIGLMLVVAFGLGILIYQVGSLLG